MEKKKFRAGFIGAGGIAGPHAYSLSSMKFFYSDAPDAELYAVTSSTEKSRETFAGRYGFSNAVDQEEFFSDEEINAVYILGPNKVHYPHFKRSLEMPSVTHIYIEKPLCSLEAEERDIRKSAAENPGLRIQSGFQYLFSPSVREALILWNSGIFGKPLHFDIRYYHGDYLQKSYREKRQNRLTPAPDGGAMADLGSHAISLAVAFLGNGIKVQSAISGGSISDVDPRSDLYSTTILTDGRSGASGTLSASRIASGTGDLLAFEFYCQNGSLKYSSHTPEFFEYFLETEGLWKKVPTGSRFGKISSFPSGHVPGGWLRAMIHAHYVFLGGDDKEAFIPGIEHALEVQRIIREIALRFS
ncbi:MAG TPA: Gfo/Idh/MocA family oxidoreductase [Bacteroidales bacterium]|nr:Gfo/Idh/MocA family oxidoreductase [Bacteroidales bacterium]